MYKLLRTKYNGLRLEKLVKHTFTITKSRRTWNNKKFNKDMPYITTINYRKTLRKMRLKLDDVVIDESKSKFITFSSEIGTDYDTISKKISYLLHLYNKKYKGLQYICAIESYARMKHFHVHVIFLFPNHNTFIDYNELKKHWCLGGIKEERFEKYRAVGVINYLTRFKIKNIHPANKEYTKFPVNAKFIRTSKNLPRRKTEVLFDEVTNEEAFQIVQSSKKYNSDIWYTKHFYYAGKWYPEKIYINNVNVEGVLLDSIYGVETGKETNQKNQC